VTPAVQRFLVLAVVAATLPASAAAPAAHSVPRGFAPLSVSVVGGSDLWALGSVPCARGRCAAVVRTTDAGRSFARVAAPPLALTRTASPEIRFADRRDGYAYVTVDTAGPGHSRLFVTHDAGATWRRVPIHDLLAFAVTRRFAYAVTARRLERSAVQASTWQSHATPFAAGGVIADVAAYGSSVWLLGTGAGGGSRSHDALARSTNAGRTFVARAGPCVPDLGGTLAPASARVVWAVCPTGMLGGAWRSTDGGTKFASLGGLRLVNSAVLASASSSSAVAAPNGAGASLLRTTDGGRTWRKSKTPGAVLYSPWIGFADAKVGAALVQTRSDGALALWRTTDGGASWSVVRFS
jgi:photosystem II stability/assembly factor-like uncharacterized protein